MLKQLLEIHRLLEKDGHYEQAAVVAEMLELLPVDGAAEPPIAYANQATSPPGERAGVRGASLCARMPTGVRGRSPLTLTLSPRGERGPETPRGQSAFWRRGLASGLAWGKSAWGIPALC